MGRHDFRVLALGAAFVLLWSSGFVGAKYGMSEAGIFTLLFWRYVLVVAVLGTVVVWLGEWIPLGLRETVRHVVIGVLAHAVWLSAVLGSMKFGLSAGLAAFITALQPILTGALSAKVANEAVSGREWLGLILGLCAVGIVVGDGVAMGGSGVAYALPFLAVLAITISSLLERRTVSGSERPRPLALVTFWHCLGSLLVLTPLALISEGLQASWTVEFVFALGWLAIVVSIGAYGLLFALLRLLPAAQVAALTYLSPPVTMVMAWLIFGENVSVAGVVGLAVAATAVSITFSGHARLRSNQTLNK